MIRDDYYKPVEGSVLENASVDGIIRELRRRYDDRFSHYLDPQELRQFEAAASGRFSGVGLTVTEVKRGLRVASVLPDTPAQRAGIEEGDLITAVDGRSLAGSARRGLHGADQGPAGDPVELRVVTGSRGRSRATSSSSAPRCELPVARGEIRRAGTGKVAYVRYASFRSGAHGELRSTLERLYRRGAEGLVLDLRDNGGGLLNEAVLSAERVPAQGRAGRLHQEPHDGRSRLRGHRRPAAETSDRRPDQPRHRFGGRDPRRGAR